MSGVLGGRWLRGGRLPSERELSLELRASRVSLRQALQRLVEWRVISVRRGSGAVVRDRRDWTVQVLPQVVRFWVRGGDPAALRGSVDHLLELRRLLYGSVMRTAARALSGRSLAEHRRTLHRLSTLRDRPHEFVAQELELIRDLLAAAGMEAATWMLNTVAEIYLSLAEPFLSLAPLPADHEASYLAYLDHIERGAPDEGASLLERFLSRYDAQLLALLPIPPAPNAPTKERPWSA